MINKDSFEKCINEKLASSDFNSLSPAMAHKDSKWPKIQTAVAIKQEHSTRLCELFDTGEWKNLNKSGFFKVKYHNPKDFVFQHMAVKQSF